MERVIGQYIHMVGANLVYKQAQLDHLELSKDNIEWLLLQGTKDTGALLADDSVPQEDLAPALFVLDRHHRLPYGRMTISLQSCSRKFLSKTICAKVKMLATT